MSMTLSHVATDTYYMFSDWLLATDEISKECCRHSYQNN